MRNENWALILGGSSGMGLATAKKLASEGFHICIIHRDRKKGTLQLEQEKKQMIQSGIQCISFNVDALRQEKRAEVVAQLKEKLVDRGKIALVLHAIARGNLKLLVPYKRQKTIQDTVAKDLEAIYASQNSYLSLQDFQSTVEAMAFSLYDWVYDLFQATLFASEAQVLGLTSEGSSKAWPTYAAVSTAKASLEALCRAIAVEFAPYGIRCNVLQPGITDTPSLRMIPGSEQMKNAARERNPNQRLTTPQDVANVVYLMTRPEARWINGAVIPVDGGEHIAP